MSTKANNLNTDDNHERVTKRKAHMLSRNDVQNFSLIVEEADRGHRFGNFHNYYTFHPTSDRIQPLFTDLYPNLPGLLVNPKKESDKSKSCVTYCDLGCNEGTLTLDVAKELTQRCKRHVKCVGMDIDKELICRAEKSAYLVSQSHNIEGYFHLCNLNDSLTLKNICISFLTDIREEERFDLISVFSTTMWIHAHGGDDGLKKFLQTICGMCRFLLIEPQPSKCYRSINVRLRKMRRPEVDINGLQLRAKIENEIKSFVVQNGFELINADEHEGKTECTTIAWKRELMLFKYIGSTEFDQKA